MKTKPLILLGSARRESDTGQLLHRLFGQDEAELVNLLDYSISHYRYDGKYPPEDAFMKVVTLMLAHEQIIFATPVYWYSMSGLLKVFFDRLTDLVTVRKDIGRLMKGKSTFLLAVGADEALPPGFEEPFRLTSAYFAMDFIASLYCKTPDFNVKGETADAFLKSLAVANPQ